MLLGRSLLNDPVELKGTSGPAVAADGAFGFFGEGTVGEGQPTSLSSKVTQLGKRAVVTGGTAGCPFMAGLPAHQLMVSISTSSSSWREEELSVESVPEALPLACSSAFMSCRSVYEGATLGLLVSSEWVVQLLSDVKGHLLKESKEGHVQQGMVKVRAVSLCGGEVLLQGVSSSNWTQLLMAEARSGVGCTGLPGGEAASEMRPIFSEESSCSECERSCEPSSTA